MEQHKEKIGICPNCGTSKGKIWSACKESICQNKGYHHIPEAYYEHIRKLPDKMDPLVGQVIDNRYLIVQKLGAGGMGSVLLALQKPFDQMVAVKMVLNIDRSQERLQRFEREARSLAQLDHPNIVKLLDYGLVTLPINKQKTPYMVLEYVGKGVELDKFFGLLKKRHIEVSVQVLAHIFSQILDALETAHSLGLIHRDIKPANIMLKRVKGNPFMVKILDFGLAKATGEANSTVSLTRDGIVGTPEYMAPEQAQKGVRADKRADLYATGVMLFEALTGVRPFTGGAMEILLNKVNPDYDPFQKLETNGLPKSIVEFLKKAIDMDPDKRFQSADEFKDAMMEALFSEDFQIKGLVSSPTTGLSLDTDFDAEFLELAKTSNITFTPGSSTSTLLKSRKNKGKNRRIIVLAGTLAAIVIIGVFFASKSKTPVQKPSPIHTPTMDIRVGFQPVSTLKKGPVDIPVLAYKHQQTKHKDNIKLKKRIKHKAFKRRTGKVKKQKTNGWNF